MSLRRVRVGTEADATVAVSIWREAAQWLIDHRQPLWTPEQFEEELALKQARSGELIVGTDEDRVVAAMLISQSDPVFWPEAEGPALYLHKLAVRRASRGGWVQLLTNWAVAQANREGMQAVRLDCVARDKLIRIYEDCGFVQVDAEPLQLGADRVTRLERRTATIS